MDVHINNKLNINSNTLFIIGYLIFFVQFWTKGLIQINEYIFYVPAVIFIIASIDIKNLTLKDILVIICINLIGLISYLYSNNMTILKTTLLLSAAKNKDIDKLIKSSFWTSIIILLTHIICTSVLNIGTLYKEVDFGRGIIERRYYFGFTHTNTAQCLFNMMLVFWLYTYLNKETEKKLKIIGHILVIVLIILMYMLTKSRTGLIIAVAFTIFSMFNCSKRYELSKYKDAICIMYIAIIVITIISIYLLNNTPLFNKMNQILTRRLEFSRYYAEEYSLTIFGQEIPNKTVVFDQGIMNSLLTYGIIINIVFYITQLKLIQKYGHENNSKRIMIICTIILYAITEDVLFYAFINLGLLFITDLVYENEGEKYGRKDSNISTNV